MSFKGKECVTKFSFSSSYEPSEIQDKLSASRLSQQVLLHNRPTKLLLNIFGSFNLEKCKDKSGLQKILDNKKESEKFNHTSIYGLLTALRALNRALTVLWGFLEPITYKRVEIRNKLDISNYPYKKASTGCHNTLDLTFLKPAKFKIVWTVLPAFMPVVVCAGQRYT